MLDGAAHRGSKFRHKCSQMLAGGVQLAIDKSTMSLPAGATATVNATLSGTVPAAGLYYGAITITGGTGEKKAHTSNGAIRVKGNRAAVDLATSNGAISVAGIATLGFSSSLDSLTVLIGR